jgi:hypothetical protein
MPSARPSSTACSQGQITIFFVFEEEAILAAVFIPGKPSIIFVSNDGDYSVSAPSRVGSWPCQQILDKAGAGKA